MRRALSFTERYSEPQGLREEEREYGIGGGGEGK
jgi:hypothetical protein